MHFTRFTPLVLVLIAFSFIGCSSRSQKTINFTKVYVETPQTSDSSIVAHLNTTVLDTIEGELRSRGYTVTNSKADADATLNSSWHISKNGQSKNEVSISLSMSLFNKKGQKVFSSDSGSEEPISFWSVAKTATTVDNILSQLPVVTAPAK